jgi:hypothetical protein
MVMGFNKIIPYPHIDLAARFCGLVLALPLTSEGARSGNRRALALILVAAIVFTGVYQALPKDITRFEQEIARFSRPMPSRKHLGPTGFFGIMAQRRK